MDKKALYKKIKYEVGFLLFVLPFISFATVSQIGADNSRVGFKPGCSEEQLDIKSILPPVARGKQANSQCVYQRTNRPIQLAAIGQDKSTASALLTSLTSQNINASQSPSISSSSQSEETGEKENKGTSPPQDQEVVNDTIPPVVHTDLKSVIVNDPILFFSISIR